MRKLICAIANSDKSNAIKRKYRHDGFLHKDFERFSYSYLRLSSGLKKS